jgi:SAM-dependent methyltransferase
MSQDERRGQRDGEPEQDPGPEPAPPPPDVSMFDAVVADVPAAIGARAMLGTAPDASRDPASGMAGEADGGESAVERDSQPDSVPERRSGPAAIMPNAQASRRARARMTLKIPDDAVPVQRAPSSPDLGREAQLAGPAAVIRAMRIISVGENEASASAPAAPPVLPLEAPHSPAPPPAALLDVPPPPASLASVGMLTPDDIVAQAAGGPSGWTPPIAPIPRSASGPLPAFTDAFEDAPVQQGWTPPLPGVAAWIAPEVRPAAPEPARGASPDDEVELSDDDVAPDLSEDSSEAVAAAATVPHPAPSSPAPPKVVRTSAPPPPPIRSATPPPPAVVVPAQGAWPGAVARAPTPLPSQVVESPIAPPVWTPPTVPSPPPPFAETPPDLHVRPPPAVPQPPDASAQPAAEPAAPRMSSVEEIPIEVATTEMGLEAEPAQPDAAAQGPVPIAPAPAQQATAAPVAEEGSEQGQAAATPPPVPARKPPRTSAREQPEPPPPPEAAQRRGTGRRARPPQIEPTTGKRKRVRPWWEELFTDDFVRSMDRLTAAQIKAEVQFIEESLAVQKGGVVLDLACGAGQHAVEFASRGYNVVGYDLSLTMLALAADEAQERGQKLNFLQGDMREMAFEEMFDGVFSWSTSFGYFEVDKNVAVIERVHRALRPGGMFLLDLMNRDYMCARVPSLAWFEGDGCVCMDDAQFDAITSRLRVKRTLMLDDGRSREIEFSIRMYSLHEIGKILHDTGFRVVEVSGHPATAGVFLGADSPRLITLAERR